ncbi:30S ribosomal protein S16 [Candidatus Kaiserbacteria bacterium RIFCSPHIGHO2_02_FULL_49_34]|uniref:Small ribosomal subunit protein bS16 n=1 Tax=Candidatus Kaiserbacteria bacterium RIFCSPHIGHO2_02_FULL_49_34 TaxID=1798491 RepID=A0A1F6DKP1_9BACT|nr:MAG: 30S ribosomal protein S16 [Candidatus Kaiserbacteria bacterium RIFCSPHIGHO2_02_FULL_49_34]
MLKMRLQRTGRKNDPSFRVVVTDSRHGPKSGKHADTIGSYSPKTNRIEIDGARAKDWIAKGVQVSDTVRNLLITQGTLEGRKVNVLPKKSPIIDEAKLKAEAEAKAKAEADAKAKAEAEAKAAEEAAAAKAAEAETPTEEAEAAQETPAAA